MWDWGSAAFNAVIVTFVFSVYLTDSVGKELDGPLSAATWLSIAIAVAGLVIALTAPVMGQRADRGGRRRRSLALWTYLTIALTALMFFVVSDAPNPWFWVGLFLLALGSITFEFAEVSYFAMLRQVSTPATVGRVSGFGWAMGYFGGIFLLLAAFVGFISGDGPNRGMLSISVDGGLNVRLVCLIAAVWFAVFALPVLLKVPENRPKKDRDHDDDKASFVESYRILWADLKGLWRSDSRTVKFLVASAIFRDGLAGVFTFGAILAVTVYGLAPGDVLIFGVAANVVAALRSCGRIRRRSRGPQGGDRRLSGRDAGDHDRAAVRRRGVHVLDLRTSHVPLRGARAVGVTLLPSATGPTRGRRSDVWPLRHYRSSGLVPRTRDVRALHVAVRRRPRRHRRDRAGAAGGSALVAAGPHSDQRRDPPPLGGRSLGP